MTETDAIAEQFRRSFSNGKFASKPYRHWLLSDIFPAETSEAIANLPFEPAPIGNTQGKRETHNSSRAFFSVENRARFDVCNGVAAALQDSATVEKLEETCGVTLKGSFLRIEYCQDTEGFWLEPHTDIGAKLFTMLVYLSKGAGTEGWGTDVLDEQKNIVVTVPHLFNTGLIFIPAQDTWHGFQPRPIEGVRKSIIVNFVRDEWRARHELCYPDRPVG
jgi:hypothetical protein